MRVNSLRLKNVRAIEEATIRFRPGFNLIVGVNGVGKTSVLHALAVCLSAVVKEENRYGRYGVLFQPDDVRLGADVLLAECEFEVGGMVRRYVVDKLSPQSGEHVAGTAGRKATHPKGEFYTIEDNGREGTRYPTLAVLFSTARSVASDSPFGLGAAKKGVASAYSGALLNRRLKLGEFAAWIRAQRALMPERAESSRMLTALSGALERFLPDYKNLRPGGTSSRESLLIDHGSDTLPVRLLSDGERGAMALVLDLTRRLAQANRGMMDPAQEAAAVVLIDELELHLHPAWQRRIVTDLTKTFPRCQFIATTHSPQVIGEVSHDRIHIIADGEVYSPPRSFGLDSSQVLDEVMDTTPRTAEVEELLVKISKTIGRDRYNDAKALLSELVGMVGEEDSEVIRIRTLLNFLGEDP